MPDQIKCRICGDDTNEIPPDAPIDWCGLCPTCAANECEAGNISMPSAEFVLRQLSGKISKLLSAAVGGDAEVHFIEAASPSEAAMKLLDADCGHEQCKPPSDMTVMDGGQIAFLHSAEDCKVLMDHDLGCPFHSASDHHMKTWPMHGRDDLKMPLITRICPHNAEHPDPDSLKWCLRLDAEFQFYHGACDGCCKPV